MKGLFCAVAMLMCSLAEAALPIDYDIVYVRQIRLGDDVNTTWPEVFHPARLDPGADLMLLHPDGTEEVLVAGGDGGITDPFVSFDAEWVYYSHFYDLQQSSLNYQRGDLPYQGADIFRIHLVTRTIEQLTFGEFTPNTGAGNWDETNPLDPPSNFNRLGYGILNLGPSPLPGGKIAFTSNRNGFVPPKGFTNPTMQLYVMDEDGSNVQAIAPMTISSALHPTILSDGRLMFSSHESQGLRDRRLWGIWTIYPDGRHWEPMLSAFNSPQAFHFMTQISNGDVAVVDYYNLNNNGFGAIYKMPLSPPAGTPRFYSAFPDDNPPIDQTVGQGFSYPFTMPFTPYGLHSITPFTHGGDQAAPIGSDGTTRVGKFTHPSAAPDNDLLVVWTPGPANDLNRPTPTPYYDAGLYMIAGGGIVNGPDELVLIRNDPRYNEAWPRAVVPYSAVHGVAEPAEIPWLPNDGSLNTALPEGTPFGLVGSSSVYKRESFPGMVSQYSDEFDGLDAFNTSQNGQSGNWFTQGADAGRYNNSDIWALRILAMEPNSHRSYGPNNGRHFQSHASERLRILGEIPLRKTGPGGSPVMDPEGNPDTSFLVKIPADTPFTFQVLDRKGHSLNMSQTWHQVRPGEVRTDCGGCHAHSQQPLAFPTTAAAAPDFNIQDLNETTPLLQPAESGDPGLDISPEPLRNVEFLADIRPILQNHCVSCHSQNNPQPPGNLVLDDLALYDGLPGDYARLADDDGANWGYAPVINNGVWRQMNASRYMRMFQSRRSLLVWKIYGQRLDGWSNADHPTESVAGDASTLPAGANPDDADLDYTGTIMPPPDSEVAPLTEQQKLTIARWIDLGAPIDTAQLNGNQGYGWTLDDLKPTLTVSQPRARFNDQPVTEIRIGAADANSGIDLQSFSVKLNLPVNGRPEDSELSDLLVQSGQGIWHIALNEALPHSDAALLQVEVADHQGNITRQMVSFSTLNPDVVFADGLE